MPLTARGSTPSVDAPVPARLSTGAFLFLSSSLVDEQAASNIALERMIASEPILRM